MSTPQMQTTCEQNKQSIVRWFEEVWNQGKRETIHELFAENGVLHDGSATFHGPDEFCRFYDSFRADFTDFRAEPRVSLAEGDLACLHWSISFRHRASNKPLQVTGTSVVRFQNGQLVEGWQNWDAASLSRQLPGYSATTT
jgi:predicted SnoaL-like aldol condensation-catalyzing enzyme